MADKKPSTKKPVAYKPHRQCAKCGSRMAEHQNRFSCGRCGYTEFKNAK